MKRISLLIGLVLIFAFAVVPTARAADPEDRVMDLLDDAAGSTGVQGVYLRKIGDGTIASNNANFVFEPASTIKALIHFHAMRQVQVTPLNLSSSIPWFAGPANYSSSPPPGTSCPDNSTLPGNNTLSTGLGQMMGPSDNRWTQAMRDFFGDGAIDATATSFGMTNTALNHMIGCGTIIPAARNQLTLVDAGLMYEDVAVGGFLNNTNRAAAYALMTQDNGTFDSITDFESSGMGLDASSIVQFKSLRQSANKAGSYGLSDGQYRTVAGWSTVPWKDSDTCEIVVEDYVYGAFIHQATGIAGGFSIRATGVELFREEINAALQSWADCEADLQITSSIVVDPPAEFDVNTPTALTVRVAMRNNGPVDVIDGELSRTSNVPADCEVTPEDATTAVPAMAHGGLVVLEMDFTVECSNPSSHQFTFDSYIELDDDAVVDPDLSNNGGLAGANIALIARADLAVTDWDFSELDNAQVQDLLVGDGFLFSTPKVVDNFGDTVDNLYHDPVDTTVVRSVTVPEGVRGILTVGAGEGPADVTIQRPLDPDEVHAAQAAGTVIEADGPATLIVEFAVDNLAIDEARDLVEQFGVACTAPGEHEIEFVNAIAAVDEHVVDPDESNNSAVVQRTIECVTPIVINIRPGNSQNFVKVNSKGILNVALLTTEAGEYDLPTDFDATTVDYETVRFATSQVLNNGAGAVASPSKKFIRDSHEVTNEKLDRADDDMVLHFSIPDSGIDGLSTESCAYGSYEDGGNTYQFFGCDSVNPKP